MIIIVDEDFNWYTIYHYDWDRDSYKDNCINDKVDIGIHEADENEGKGG